MVFERNSTHILPMHTVRTCAVMFSVGLLGNLLALAMLIRTAGRSCISCSSRGGRTGTSGTFRAAFGNSSGGGGSGGNGRELGAFYTLVLALTVTDLLGTCLTSPVAITAYGRNLTVPALGGAGLCTSMAACMLFFGAATQGIVCAMAVERVLCISAPFAYAGSAHRDVVLRVTLGLIFAGAALLGAAPPLGIADAVVYEPGTWCYVDMRPRGGRDGVSGAAFPLAYASVMATLTLVTVVCNACVMVTLGRMIRRKRVLQAAGPGGAAGARERRRQHRQEEDNLTLLVSITLVSLVCTTPLTVRAIVNAVTSKSDYNRDLNALRLHAFNPILDPWMYLLGRHSFFVRIRRFVRRLCGRCPRPCLGRETPGKVSRAAPGLRKALADTGAERGLVSVRRGEQQSLDQQQQQRDPNHHPQREHTEQRHHQQQHQQQKQQDPNYNQQQQQEQQQQQSHHQQKHWQLGMLGRHCKLQQQQQVQQQQLCHLQKQQLQMVPHGQQCL